MKQFNLRVVENNIGNLFEFLATMSLIDSNSLPFVIKIDEAPDLSKIKIGKGTFLQFLDNFCASKGFEKNQIRLECGNLIQDKSVWPHIEIKNLALNPIIDFSNKHRLSTKKEILKTFGIFIGCSRWHRLYLAILLYCKHKDKAIISFWQYLFNTDQPTSLDIDKLLFEFSNEKDVQLLKDIITFGNELPLHLHKDDFKQNNNLGFINWDRAFDRMENAYKKIFIDIVCETWHEGCCFSPTEKIFRPIVFETAFLVYGPKNYLKNLKSIGFKTFNDYWDETYDNFEGVKRLRMIEKVINSLSKLSINQLVSLNNTIRPIILHNKNILKNLNVKKITDLLEKN